MFSAIFQCCVSIDIFQSHFVSMQFDSIAKPESLNKLMKLLVRAQKYEYSSIEAIPCQGKTRQALFVLEEL